MNEEDGGCPCLSTRCWTSSEVGQVEATLSNELFHGYENNFWDMSLDESVACYLPYTPYVNIRNYIPHATAHIQWSNINHSNTASIPHTLF